GSETLAHQLDGAHLEIRLQNPSLQLEDGHAVAFVEALRLAQELLRGQCLTPAVIAGLFIEQVGGERYPSPRRAAEQVVHRPTGCLADEVQACDLDGRKDVRAAD